MSTAPMLDPGTMTLRSEHKVVVIRKEPGRPEPSYRVTIPRADFERIAHGNREGRDGLRLIKLGTRTFSTSSLAVAERVVADARTRFGLELTVDVNTTPKKLLERPWVVELGLGQRIVAVGNYKTQDEALAAGMAAWRDELAEGIEEIRQARGGSLSWGADIGIPSEPEIIVRPA